VKVAEAQAAAANNKTLNCVRDSERISHTVLSVHQITMGSKKGFNMKIAAFFSGAGGLDLGFRNAGFEVTWANEYDKDIWATYEINHPETTLDRRSILDIVPSDIPDVDGIIGGPPCQSWSEAGKSRGIEDQRGQLFFEYMELIKAKKPKFFLAENVSGILFSKHDDAVTELLNNFAKIGYNVSYGLLNANNYGVPQDRERVIIVGIRTDLDKVFTPPKELEYRPSLKDAIADLESSAQPASTGNKHNSDLEVLNHEFMTGGFSSMFMSRNRVRDWDSPSFTIQAGGRHAPLHPQAPRMEKIGKDEWRFKPGFEDQYRRLSVRECARVQTFPDDFEFVYTNVADGYKMIGNAVPVTFAEHLATQVKVAIGNVETERPSRLSRGKIYTFKSLASI
jgi:DNA (cytosine-5)-methyltransferase 1